MSLKSRIIDGLGRKNDVEVSNNNAIKVANLQYYNYNNEIRYFINPTYGYNMNINASSNLDLLIHNGTDDVAWTGSNIAGTSLVFNSTTDPYEGTYHINGTSLVNDTIFQLKNGNTIGTIDYNSITGFINLISLGNPVAELYIYGYNTLTSQQVGTEVSIFDYINTGNTGVYQSFNISFSDMGLENEIIDAFRFRVDILASTMSVYFDNIYLTSLGTGVGSQTFTLQPNKGENLIIDNLNWLIIDNYDGITGQNGIMKLEYDKILGETLSNGIVYQRYKDNDILFSINLKDISDWLTTPNITIKNYSSDGTNTMMNVDYRFFEPYVMTENDKIILIVEDNMSGFLVFRTSGNCKKLIGSTGNKYNGSDILYSYGS